MKTALYFIFLIFVSLPAFAQSNGVHRFALVAGSNDGGAERVKLRYATSDADSVAAVLQEIGGVSKDDLVTLSNPDSASLKDAFLDMKKRVSLVKKQSARTEFFLYYSGHSDEEGLLLNGVLFKYSELRSLINDINADVRVAIVDSCASGALTLQKGGTKKPPFLRDDSTAVKGRAYLTSSSADEVAQESERIGGSFFTYYLVSGLRGAADSTRDGKITLNEAYQYAFSETLARTENTKYGPQHPAYEIQLTGTGDLVMTDLRETSASISFDAALAGQLYIRDSKGRLVCELRKEKGNPTELALAPGSYKINIEQNQKLYQSALSLESGKKKSVIFSDFSEANKESTQARGDETVIDISAIPLDVAQAQPPSATPEEEAGEALAPTTPTDAPKKPKRLALNLSLTPNVNLGRVFGDRTVSTFSLGFFDGNKSLHGASIGVLTSYVSEDLKGAQITAGVAVARKDVFGAQIAAMNAIAGSDLTGLQVSAAGIVKQDVLGLQASGTLNVVGGGFTGLQATAMANFVSKDFFGLQAALNNVVGGDFMGLQASGGFNIVGGEMKGLQAGIINYANDNAFGLQAGVVNYTRHKNIGLQAGVANVVTGEASGLQASAANVTTGDFDGVQAGVVNISRDVNGAQLGVLNIARNVKGTQVGLVNISNQMDGIPVGLISFAKEGMHRVDFWANDLSPINVGLRLGSKYVYSLFMCSANPLVDANIACGMGLGGRKPGEKLSLNIDATVLDSVTDLKSDDLFTALRVFGELQPSKRLPLSVFAGPTMNAIITFGPEVPAVRDVLPGQLYRGDTASLLLAPGFVLGVSL